MRIKLFAILFLMIAVVFANAQVLEGSYLQEIKTEIQLPENAGNNVIKLFSANQNVIAVTSNGVFRYRNGNWSGQSNGSHWRTAAPDKQGKIWLASTNTIQQEAGKNSLCRNSSVYRV